MLDKHQGGIRSNPLTEHNPVPVFLSVLVFTASEIKVRDSKMGAKLWCVTELMKARVEECEPV